MKQNDIFLDKEAFYWLLQSICLVLNKPYCHRLAAQQLIGDFSLEHLADALCHYGVQAKSAAVSPSRVADHALPAIAWMNSDTAPGALADNVAKFGEANAGPSPLIILALHDQHMLVLAHSDTAPVKLSADAFRERYAGHLTSLTLVQANLDDADEPAVTRAPFGFSRFVPELLRYKSLWREILLASLVIQCLALATPLFTQAIIDKVIVHRTQSTLVVLVVGMAAFMLFSAVLSWLRQYLLLHTGNRIDAKLGADVFSHLFKLPPLYFQHRATGTIAARLHGIEVIREFLAGASVTLILDLPFLCIFLGIMLFYSVPLTCVVFALLSLVVVLSLSVAPQFQDKLQQQFKLGARNQAYVTEYLVGLETVKSLQLEPQINARYKDYLASYLTAGFDTKQLANTYNVASNVLEQVMTLSVLGVGAYLVMHDPSFSIGMLIAFQMFAGRVAQPMLRMVGLWQQFQQARLSMARLGDLMDAPTEPYSVMPTRTTSRKGRVRIEQVAFRYAEHAPFVYQNLSMTIEPGQVTGIMGPSGCGKSTLAKLLQGFYQPGAGRILIDGVDIRYLSANELRGYFGVVPQETTLFSGTIFDNLQMANPNASFEQIAASCRMAEIHDVIEALPQGYQTIIGERGAGLSGGQKQRIAIARALLKRPSILVFDEATSALDAATAESFARTINKLRGKVTMLFITHGLPKGLQVDAIFRLNPNGVQLVARASDAPQKTAASTVA
jgi:subfamily B ATP-binding cassette protein HlyB/CyaB